MRQVEIALWVVTLAGAAMPTVLMLALAAGWRP